MPLVIRDNVYSPPFSKGDVYVKDTGTWKEAENVYVKHNGYWFPMWVSSQTPLARYGFGSYAGPDLDQNGYLGIQDFFDKVFIDQVTSNVDNVEFFGSGGDLDTTYGYLAYPAELGTLLQKEFQHRKFDMLDGVWAEPSPPEFDITGYARGGWDGIEAPFDLAVPFYHWTPSGPKIVVADDGSGLKTWYLYRTDFPIRDITFRVIDWPNI